MFDTAERIVGELPQTSTQLARGILGLAFGGTVAVLMTLLVYLLDAPMPVLAALSLLAMLGAALAIGAPLWFWILQPFHHRND